MNSSQFQSIDGSIFWIFFRCAIIDPAMSSTPQYGHSICRLRPSLYVSPLTVILRTSASSGTPDWIAHGCHVTALELATLAISPYHQKRSIITLTGPWRHSGSCNPTRPSYTWKTPCTVPPKVAEHHERLICPLLSWTDSSAKHFWQPDWRW